MSVWVMTSPLTIAVALMIDGMVLPNTVGLAGRLSPLTLDPGWPSADAGWPCADAAATAIDATKVASEPAVNRLIFNPTLKFLIFQSLVARPFIQSR